MNKRQKRLLWVLALVLVLIVCAALVVNALRNNMVFFHTPTDVRAEKVELNKYVRVGGLVKPGTLVKHVGSVQIDFELVDDWDSIPVSYEGLLPDLFGEGQGAVLEGEWNGERFMATRVFAKHDENYMPPEVAKAATDMHNKYTGGAIPLEGAEKDAYAEGTP